MTAPSCVASLVRLSTPKGVSGRSPSLVLLVSRFSLVSLPLFSLVQLVGPVSLAIFHPFALDGLSPCDLLAGTRRRLSKIAKLKKGKEKKKGSKRAGISARPPPTFLRQPPHAPYPSAASPTPTPSSQSWNPPARREVVGPLCRRLARASQTSLSGQTPATLPNSSPRSRIRSRSASASRSTRSNGLDEVEGNPPSESITLPISTIPARRSISKRTTSESRIPRPDVSPEPSVF